MNKKIVLITGSNKGIGFETAKQLLELGFDVYISSRDIIKGQEAVENLNRMGLKPRFVQIDVTNRESIIAAKNQIEQEVGKIDVLINNAGIMLDRTGILDIPVEVLDKTLKANVYGPMMMIQEFYPIINPGGKILNLSSILGQLKSMKNFSPAYSLSKTALNALTRQFAAALAKYDIAVYSIHPGWVKTDMGGTDAQLEVRDGAYTSVWLATEGTMEQSGKFFYRKNELEW